MIATILGRDGFRKGMDRYFEKHDGEAATIEDFIASFEEANGADLSHFALWYEEAGTPTLTVTENYDAGAQRLTLGLKQELTQGAAGTPTKPLHIPVRFGLVGANGQDRDVKPAAGAEVEGDVIHLTAAEETVVFEDVGDRPYLSILRDFSAPGDLEARPERGGPAGARPPRPEPLQPLARPQRSRLRGAGAGQPRRGRGSRDPARDRRGGAGIDSATTRWSRRSGRRSWRCPARPRSPG